MQFLFGWISKYFQYYCMIVVDYTVLQLYLMIMINIISVSELNKQTSQSTSGTC